MSTGHRPKNPTRPNTRLLFERPWDLHSASEREEVLAHIAGMAPRQLEFLQALAAPGEPVVDPRRYLTLLQITGATADDLADWYALPLVELMEDPRVQEYCYRVEEARCTAVNVAFPTTLPQADTLYRTSCEQYFRETCAFGMLLAGDPTPEQIAEHRIACRRAEAKALLWATLCQRALRLPAPEPFPIPEKAIR